ncbi:hypothetical protein JCM11251_007028 [Rhodosporidiobolus azoricus]
MVSTAIWARAEEGEEEKGVSGKRARARTTPPPGLPSIPLEVQLLIVEFSLSSSATYSHLRTRYELLLTYSRVSRAWYAFTRRLLYRDVLLPSPQRASLFLRTCSSDDIKPTLVRTLRVGKVPWLGKTYEQMADEQEAMMEEEDSPDGTVVAEAFGLDELLRRCSALEELWIAGVSHCLLSALQHAQSLEALHLLRCGVCDCDTDPFSPATAPLVLPSLVRAELFIRTSSRSVRETFLTPSALPAMRHFSYACHDDDLPPPSLLPQLTSLSTVTDIPPSIKESPLLFLDAYQLPVREALDHLPPTLLIVRLNDFNPLFSSFPWLLIDASTSNALADRLPNLRELWVPASYSEWRDDTKESVREMVQKWVKRWEARGVKVVFEEEEPENVGLVVEDRRLSERGAWDFTFQELCGRVDRWKLEGAEETRE